MDCNHPVGLKLPILDFGSRLRHVLPSPKEGLKVRFLPYKTLSEMFSVNGWETLALGGAFVLAKTVLMMNTRKADYSC